MSTSSNDDNLEIVVIDTNAFGHGRANLRTLESVANRLQKRGLEVWVPEVVAWEWAEHVADDIDKFNANSRATRKTLENAMMPAEVPTVLHEDRSVVYQTFLEKLGNIENVKVLELTGEAARLAIRDQILLQGAASKKSDVKTGAADSAFLQGIIDATAGGFGTVILVTRNLVDVERFCKSRSLTPPFMTSMHSLFDKLQEVVPAPSALSAAIIRYMNVSLPWRYVFHPHEDAPPGPVDITISAYRVPTLRDIPEEAQVEGVEVLVVHSLISLDEVGVGQDDEKGGVWPLLADAWAKLEATVDITYFVLDGDGKVDMNVVTVRVEIDAYLTFTVTDEMEIIDVVAYDDAEITKEMPWQ